MSIIRLPSAIFGAVLGFAMQTGFAQAEIQLRPVEYNHGDATLSGYFAHDDAVTGPRPGILIFHDRAGLTEKGIEDARMFAAMGYAAFAADMFGKGVLPQSVPEMREQTDVHRADRSLMRARAQAGLEILSTNPLVDSSKLAAIGYCFGGTVAIELAETGAPLAGIVPVHGSYDGFAPEGAQNIQGSVLILHGGEDRPAPLEEVLMFVDDLRAADIAWQMELYSGAGHGFTDTALKGEGSLDPDLALERLVIGLSG
jgi:dienelactone hydrolase